jgi:hypothetical protein
LRDLFYLPFGLAEVPDQRHQDSSEQDSTTKLANRGRGKLLTAMWTADVHPTRTRTMCVRLKQEGPMTTAVYLDKVYTRKQVAELLGTSVRTVQRLDQRGILRRTQITPKIVGYRDSIVRRFLDEQTRK